MQSVCRGESRQHKSEFAPSKSKLYSHADAAIYRVYCLALLLFMVLFIKGDSTTAVLVGYVTAVALLPKPIVSSVK